ncbi:TPA: hypothetical protein ACU21L_002107 [Mannheimia haemolytica]|nr:hypothetical protein BHC25_04745 [Mannheimia haemolytica]
MKLILKEYLRSLKERDELDRILPDLLSQMGANVFVSPIRGRREYGVDVACFGKLENDEVEKIYLFSIKSGDLTRNVWDGNSDQSLRQSLNEIFDVFIQRRIPVQYRGKEIVVCPCFGGNNLIQDEITGFMDRYLKLNEISFSIWDGDKLAGFIQDYFLREDIAPDDIKSLLRKSLAMVDEPEISILHFKKLVKHLFSRKMKSKDDYLTVFRQLYIYTSILWIWSRNENNTESAYISSEFVILHTWNAYKKYISNKKIRGNCPVYQQLISLIMLHMRISEEYIQRAVIPLSQEKYLLSSSIGLSSVDVNIKLFDILSRISLLGVWNFWLYQRVNEEHKEFLTNRHYELTNLVWDVIVNNSSLYSPYMDNQIIDISIAMIFLNSSKDVNTNNMIEWLNQVIDNCAFCLNQGRSYITTINNYRDLIDFIDFSGDRNKFEKLTSASVFYPYLFLFLSQLKDDLGTNRISSIKKERLSHCNFQVFFFNSISEEYLYNDEEIHGATLPNIDISSSEKFLEQLNFEVKNQKENFENISAIKHGFYPIVLLACRHHRLPIPINFFLTGDSN